MSPHNSQLVAFEGAVVVMAMRNATAVGDVAAAIGVATVDNVVVVVGDVATVAVWVQRC